MTNKFQFTLIVFSFCIGLLNAQSELNINLNIDWTERSIATDPLGLDSLSIWDCNDCQIYHKHPQVPFFVKRIKISENSKASIRIENEKTEIVNISDNQSEEQLAENYTIHSWVSQERNDYYLTFKIIPFKKNNGVIYQLNKGNVNIRLTPIRTTVRRDPTATTSKLSTGEIYKIAIPKTGVYELDQDFLTSLGINIASVNPRNIQLLGLQGGKLPQDLNIDRLDDLEELAIQITGEGDGSFDSQDKIRFYAEGPDRWEFLGNDYIFSKNIYDNRNYVYIKIGSEAGKRIGTQVSASNADYSFNEYDYLLRYEEDKINLLGDYNLTQGSGQDWYGDRFKTTRTREYSSFFEIPDLTSDEAILKAAFAARSASSSNATLRIGSENRSINFPSSQVTDVEAEYAKRQNLLTTVNISSSPVVEFSFPETGTTSEAWMDFIQLESRRSLRMFGNQMVFSDKNSSEADVAEFSLSNANGIDVWDITEYSGTQEIVSGSNSANITHAFATDGINRRFIAFNSYLQAEAIGLIENQNLHGINDAEVIILYHKDFEEAALRLEEHRETVKPLDVISIDVSEVYNEFSSGRIDPTALRNFAKMVYDRSDRFRYLVLFGDGSYDYLGLMPGVPFGNFIPTYQTLETLRPIEAFPSDDYYALLSDQEGKNLKGELDIAVGRITSKTLAEANTIVNKIIHYETSAETLGDWRTNILFNADDEDGNTHLFQADDIAGQVQEENPLFNQSKIYWDAYVQESTPGGDRYPDATAALSNAIESGRLVTNYLGHGGSNGWSQERVLKVTDIQNFSNFDKLTTFVTATCSFTGYDDPGRITAGELCLTNPNGGAVSLLTTTRAVYISGNKRLTEAVYDTIFTKVDGKFLRLGEIMRRAKNSNAQDTFGTNARKFAMIGDPTLTLAIPQYNVVTSAINGKPVDDTVIDTTGASLDTIGALQKVTIEGFIANIDGSVKTDFNGTVFPSILDKESTIRTLSNDGTQPIDFEVFKNVIFKGSASVTNGRFSFSFIVPLDIDYSFGAGKISYYATDGSSEDAAGYYNNLIIGGTAEDAVADDQGPQIDLFMDNLGFEFGGTTGTTPTLIATLSDDNGINITGNSIGHDIIGILDDNQNQSFILNDFYEAEVDNYTNGRIDFPLEELELGSHRILVKAWDIANNSAEAVTEFVVVDSELTALENVLNYPNPFTTKTAFTFTTDLRNVPLDILVNVYTLSGKLVKTIQTEGIASGGFVGDIEWTGKDDFGSNLAKGVYLYKIKVYSNQLNTGQESSFEKLVILK